MDAVAKLIFYSETLRASIYFNIFHKNILGYSMQPMLPMLFLNKILASERNKQKYIYQMTPSPETYKGNEKLNKQWLYDK